MPPNKFLHLILVLGYAAFVTAQVRNVTSAGTYGQTSEIIQFLKEGEKAIRISQEKDIILILGVTGSGKSTLSQFVTGNDEHLEAVQIGEGTGEYVIRDKRNKVCRGTTDSCTTIPELIVDWKTRTPVYDCPGFADTRHVKYDLSVSYFIKKVISSANSVKLVFTVSYPSVRLGVDRQNFMLLVKNAVDMIKDMDKFKDSIALIVTKVDNQYMLRKDTAVWVTDEDVIHNTVKFLEEVKNNLKTKLSQKSFPYSDHVSLGNALKFINVLLTRNKKEYPRIGIFRSPNDAGKLTSPMMLENKESLVKMIHQNIKFTECDSDDFGYTVSAESINRMYKLVDEINKKVASDVEALGKEIEEGLLLHERDDGDVALLYEKFHLGHEAMLNLTDVKEAEDLREYLMKIRRAAGLLNTDLSRKRVDSISHYGRFLNFVQTVSDITTDRPLEWVEGLKSVVKSFDESQRWYHFLLNLQAKLQKHEVQQNLRKNSTTLDKLREQIEMFGYDASPFKEQLRQFLTEVLKEESEKEYGTIKNTKLNRWKVEFLKNMLDFQVFTFCEANKLRTVGNYVHMSDVALKKCNNVKFVEIFALTKIFIDANYEKTGSKIQLSILAPTWEVIGSPKIILDGEPGREYTSKAKDGAWPGANGHDGLPGSPGGAAGNFLGFGWNCVNCQFLTISVNGGSGGNGQDGGDGMDGKNGTRPPTSNHSKNVINYLGFVKVSHEDKGNMGQVGGDGGRGGEGGKGGKRGRISIVMFDTPDTNLPRTSEVDGTSGIPGNSGKGGSGGHSEHLVESKTSILWGLFAWQNGVVSHRSFSSRNGSSKAEHNNEGIKYPEPPVDLVNPSFPVNSYKAYVRENMDKSLSKVALEQFLEQLETCEAVRDLYDTLGLVNDLQCLEEQYLKLHRRVPMLPSYRSLLDRIKAFAADPTSTEMTGQFRKVRAFLYLSTLSKICTIDNNLSNNIVIDPKAFIRSIVEDLEQLKKGFMVAKRNNQERNVIQKTISSNIAEADSFLKKDIILETQKILAEVDVHIGALISETQRLQNITRKELKQLNEYMIQKAISSVLKVACIALDFFSGAGLAVGEVIERTNLIPAALALEGSDDDSPSSKMFGSLQKAEDDFVSLISNHTAEKVKLFVSKLLDVEKLFLPFEGRASALNDTRSVISGVYEELSGISVSSENYFETVDRKRRELIAFLRNKKKSVEMAVQKEPSLEKALDALDRSEQILELPSGAYKIMRSNQVLESRTGKLDASKKLKWLEVYEETIYAVLVPLCAKLRDQFNGFSSFEGKSHAAVDVGKWEVQTALIDINRLLMSMADEFELKGSLGGTLEKLKFGISTMVEVYDRIQNHHDQAALVNYMAEIASNEANVIEVTDANLRNATDNLKVILKTNLVLADYEMAMNALAQHVFPFAKAYMEEYELPTSLKAKDSVDDLLSEAEYRITSIEHKLIKNDLTIDKSLDDHFFPDVSFTSTSQLGPFYQWKYESFSKEISQLLQGKEVVLHADITKGLTYNAVKFNEIGIRFRFDNKASQVVFDEIMEKFSIEMIHFGMSYYRCGTKFYVMTHQSHNIKHSVNEGFDGFEDYNGVYEKICKNEPLLSPYTLWKVKLHNVSTSFQALANFTDEIIDVVLEGSGTYVSRDIDRTFCRDHLEDFYKIAETIDELPIVDHGMDSPEKTEGVVGGRRRRSVGESKIIAEKNERQDVFSLLNKIGRRLTGEGMNSLRNMMKKPNHGSFHGSPQRYFKVDSVVGESVTDSSRKYTGEPRFSGDDSSPSSQVLVASQNDLKLLDVLMGLKTVTNSSAMVVASGGYA